MKAMILAAGYGTRLKPLTDNKPKALVEIKGIPLLELAINRIKKFGISDIIVNVHHFADQIEEFLLKKENFGINIQISDEREQLLDTGGGLLKARWFLDGVEPFLVYNVDILSDINLTNLINYHVDNQPIVTLAVKERETSRQILFDDENNLCEWRNVITGQLKLSRQPVGVLKPLAYSCIHVSSPQIFDLMEERGAFSIMDVYLRLAKEHNIKAFSQNPSKWYDMGRLEHIEWFNENMNLDFLS